MELRIVRNTFYEDATTGAMFIDGVFKYCTLEDKDRGLDSGWDLKAIKAAKVYGKTAIPTGRYKVIMDYWERRKRVAPRVLEVKGFDGIRIHSGNTANDSLGCPLVGFKSFRDSISNSTAARVDMDKILKEAFDRGEEIWLTIERINFLA